MEFLRFTKLFALCIACCFAMAACSDDKEESQPEQPEVERDPYYLMETLKTSFFVYPNAELREIATITCDITDHNGNKKTYKLNKNNVVEVEIISTQPDDPNLFSGMTRAPWINLPVTASMTVNATLKSDFTPDPECDYNIEIQIDGMMTAYSSYGNELSEKRAPKTITKTFEAGEGLTEWVGETFPYIVEFKCEFVNNKFQVTQVK